MRYANIIYNDVVNTDGVALTFFAQGCTHRCSGCFSKSTWDFNGGNELTDGKIAEMIYCLSNYKYDYLCLLGGDPIDNIDTSKFIIDLCKKYQPNIKVWCYTGYEIEHMNNLEISNDLDVLVCNEFKKELCSPLLKFMGSSNQIIYKKEEAIWKIDQILNGKI